MVLITMSGTVGNTTVALEDWKYPVNSNQDIAKVVTNGLNPFYLSIFLNTPFGKLQMQRLQAGAIQQHLYLSQIEKLIIPIFSNTFQNNIEKIIAHSNNTLKRAKSFYYDAENILLNELGLHNWQPTQVNTEVKSFKNSFLQSGRLDAEYYQPKYDEIIGKNKNYSNGYDILKNVCSVNDKNYSPKPNQQYKYVELSNIDGSGSINGCINDIGANLPSRARKKIKAGDILVSSIEGSLQSCALVTKEYDDALCSTGFYVIKSDKINSETLLALFKSPMLQLLLKQNCSGTILTSINRADLDKIVLPIIKEKNQQQISELIQQSFSLKKQSEQLLQTAKQAVEMAIEEGEEKAMEFITRKY